MDRRSDVTEPEHGPGCPRLQFWDAGDLDAPQTSSKPVKGKRWQAVDANWLAKLNLMLKRARDRSLDD